MCLTDYLKVSCTLYVVLTAGPSLLPSESFPPTAFLHSTVGYVRKHVANLDRERIRPLALLLAVDSPSCLLEKEKGNSHLPQTYLHLASLGTSSDIAN